MEWPKLEPPPFVSLEVVIATDYFECGLVVGREHLPQKCQFFAPPSIAFDFIAMELSGIPPFLKEKPQFSGVYIVKIFITEFHAHVPSNQETAPLSCIGTAGR